MSKEDIIRAWKDSEYRDSLSEEQRSQLPENPAGLLDSTDTSMESISGGSRSGGSRVGNLKPQTVTSTIDVCCSTGDLPCNGNTQDLLCIVD